jgi:hypothetical protein
MSLSSSHLVLAIASQIHEEWRAPRRRPDGTFEPRTKETQDAEWIAAHGVGEVDIANTAFLDLPADWRRENTIAAELAARVVEATIDYLAALIHEQWVSRHFEEDWARDSGLLMAFRDLPDDEQEKDRVIARTALRYALTTPSSAG